MSKGLLWSLITVFTLAFVFTISAFIRSGKPLKSIVVSAAQGIVSLFALNVVSSFTGIMVSVNIFTMIFSAVLGLPGVASLMIMKVIFKV